ncbi:metallophosphoesterase family protein [Desulfovibrio sp. OttesenSCG-928-C06]|nr:metallophosphoesterase family protein [Desulfovibrio sp. OttesenSCG-928-C06]
MPSTTHWIVFGDLHNEIHNLQEIMDLDEADGIIVTGDLTFMGGAGDAQKVMDAITARNPKVYAQIGNMDKSEVTDLLKKKECNLHGEARKIHEKATLIGVGGSTPTPFNTPSEFSEEEIAELLEQALAKAGDYQNLVLVSHTPPLNTACDRIESGAHVGSKAVREFIERVQPAICLCGHIHESKGIDIIGNTIVINPGPLNSGGYAVMALCDGTVRAGLCDINEGCTLHCGI